MGKILDFIKEKSYYLLGGTVILIIVIILISACSGNKMGTYESIENEMVRAAKSYYTSNENLLPKEDGGIVKVSISTLVDLELIDEVIDPKNESQTCSGYVEVTKVSQEYSYTPFLTCSGNYEPKYLTDLIKETTLDEYGNGVYEMNGEYIYRGDEVKNYVSFNDQLWRIVKIDNEGDIKLVLAETLPETYVWDDKYNSETQSDYGVTTNYLLSSIRKSLNDYYENTFSNDNKAKIVPKDICVGKYSLNDNFDINKECSIVQPNEKISLLTASDYHRASLDESCINLGSGECTNRNYLNSEGINTWLLNSITENSYEALFLFNSITEIRANTLDYINPVIYISSKNIISSGNGSIKQPYIIK